MSRRVQTSIRVDRDLKKWFDDRCGAGGLFGSFNHACEQGLVLLKRKVEEGGHHLE